MTNQTNESYNGYTNYETWNFNLWYEEALQVLIAEAIDSDETVTANTIYCIIDQFIEDMEDESGVQVMSFNQDALSHAYAKINRYELTEMYCDSNEIPYNLTF